MYGCDELWMMGWGPLESPLIWRIANIRANLGMQRTLRFLFFSFSFRFDQRLAAVRMDTGLPPFALICLFVLVGRMRLIVIPFLASTAHGFPSVRLLTYPSILLLFFHVYDVGPHPISSPSVPVRH